MPVRVTPSAVRRVLPRVVLRTILFAVGGFVLPVVTPFSLRAQAAGSVVSAPTAESKVRDVVLRGRVSRIDARPIAGATVYVLETLEETRTDSTGRFELRSTHRGLATVVARAVGFVPATVDLELPSDSVVTLSLTAQPPMLGIVAVVAAGEYTLGSGQTATLSPLEVVQTPGAAANVARAIQTLPGAQNVDEGTGVFVRGGDVTETRVLIDDAWMLSPVRFDNPTGHVTTTVNPFLLSRTVFSSGGFGARHGNALSGLIRMETADAPTRATASLSASIGSLSASAGFRPHRRVGVRASADVNTLAPLVGVFGQAQPYDPAPRGGNASAAIEWATSPAGRVRVFGVRQASRFGVGEADVSGDTRYGASTGEEMAVLSWRDSSTRWRPAVTVAWSGHARDEQFGSFTLRTQLRAPQMLASIGWRDDRGLVITAGAEHELLHALYRGQTSLGITSSGAPREVFSETTTSRRDGLFVDVTRTFVRGVRVGIGARSDRSTLTGRRTVDPRTSIAWQVGAVGLTAAWGIYHQVAEPTFRRSTSTPFAPMRVAQSIIGLQWGSDSSGVRVEGYDKRYRDLWQFAPDFSPVGGGTGHARGMDMQARLRLGASSRMRLTYSHVHARRTDPASQRLAPTLADITHSLVWVSERTWRSLTVSSALRYASGRPFTDIVGGVTDSAPLAPQYAAPFAARLPTYSRTDVSLSWYRGLGERRGMVLWASASNLFGRRNVMRYRWSDDFRTRMPVLAPFNRSVFFGSTLLL